MNTTEIESLRTFAVAHGELEFAHLCTAALSALQGNESEQWAVEQICAARFRMDGVLGHPAILNDWALTVIRSTDTTRPDGAIARKMSAPV